MKSNKVQSKIIAGRYKGMSIDLPSHVTTRSTKSIMKESLFNTLQFDIVGENFVEVFGGSGSMGLEALSRGAKHAYFIELDKNAFHVLKSNCSKIAPADTTLFHGSSFEVMPKVLEKIDSPAYFYIDPPFSIREGMEDIYEQVNTLIGSIPKKKMQLIIVEHMSAHKMPETIATYHITKTKKFGNSSLTYYS
jgi:16S rRNA (guanine(966)-N(2))-methyltransferase RsmD